MAQRKRKSAAVEEEQCNGTGESPKLQKRIKSFGRISKLSEHEAVTERKKLQQPSEQPFPAACAVQGVSTSEKKRKRRSEATVDDGEQSRSQDQHTAVAAPSTPRSKRTRHIVPPSPARSAAALFDKLDINAPSLFAGGNREQESYETPPATPDCDDASTLQHLQSLYASFLAALALYHAHNASASTVSIQTLLPIITKHWQKRSVNLDDLRLLLAISQGTTAGFSLQDHGRSGVYLVGNELCNNGLSMRMISRTDTAPLRTRFDDALHQAWQRWRNSSSAQDRSAEAFLNQITLPGIAKHQATSKTASLFARGEQRLAELKASSAAAHGASSATSMLQQDVAQSPPKAANSRGSALLDRILAKQSLSSKLPAGPSKAQIERKAALDRVEDIARVLYLLAGARERASFSMVNVTQQLQQSLRNPISNADVQRCLALMATEIVPDFVKIVMSEGVHGVVITRNGSVARAELRSRLDRASL